MISEYSEVMIEKDASYKHWGRKDIEGFVRKYKKEHNVRIEFLELIKTKPAVDEEGRVISKGHERWEPRGKYDAFFLVHDDDLTTINQLRLDEPAMKLFWMEDLVEGMIADGEEHEPWSQKYIESAEYIKATGNSATLLLGYPEYVEYWPDYKFAAQEETEPVELWKFMRKAAA